MVRRLAGGPQNQAAGSVVASVGNADLEGLVIQVSEGMTVTGRVEIQGQHLRRPSLAKPTRDASVAETGMMMLGTRQVCRPGRQFHDAGSDAGQIPGGSRERAGRVPRTGDVGRPGYFGKEIDLTGGVPGPVQLMYRTDGASVTGVWNAGCQAGNAAAGGSRASGPRAAGGHSAKTSRG